MNAQGLFFRMKRNAWYTNTIVDAGWDVSVHSSTLVACVIVFLCMVSMLPP